MSLVQQAEYGRVPRQAKNLGGRMSKREFYEARTEELLKPIVEAAGVEIYDVEYVTRRKEATFIFAATLTRTAA